MIGINPPMIGTDRSSQAMSPKVHKIEKATTNKGRKIPIQLRKLSNNKNIISPKAIGVKVLRSRLTLSIDSADEITGLAK